MAGIDTTQLQDWRPQAVIGGVRSGEDDATCDGCLQQQPGDAYGRDGEQASAGETAWCDLIDRNDTDGSFVIVQGH